MGPELLADQLTYNQKVLNVNVADLDHDESLISPSQGGNCLNWVLGHVVASRGSMLKLTGAEPLWNEERAVPYRRGSEPISAAAALPLEEILADFKTCQERLLTALSKLSDEDLNVSTSVKFFKGDQETVGSALAAFVFHETYHIGQTGLLRRMTGREGAVK